MRPHILLPKLHLQPLVVVFAMLAILVGLPATALASSHREAPFSSQNPAVDATDFYMFRSYEPGREGFVTLVANYIPLQDAYGGPNYFSLDPSARYRINIENNGDGIEDLVFEFQFLNILNGQTLPVGGANVAHPLRTIAPLDGTAGLAANEFELYVVRLIRGGGAPELVTNGNTGGVLFTKALDNAGSKTFANYDAYARGRIGPIQIPGCGDGRVFVGQRKDPFAVNLGEVFDLVNLNPVGDPQSERSATADKNVTAIALEVPIDCLTQGHGPVIGGWTTARLPRNRTLSVNPTFSDPDSTSGDFVQVSRLGNPLVNEVVIGLPDKNKFNASHPRNDLANFATYVTNPTLPLIIQSLFGVQAPTNFPRNDLVATFVTGLNGLNDLGVGEMMRLNTAIPPTLKANQKELGVIGGDNAGYPNGRRPGDDVVDISLRVVMGVLCHVGLGLCNPADAPDGLLPYTDQTYQGPDQFDDAFPYLTTPIGGSPNAYRTFDANLTGGQENPAFSSPFSGSCSGVLNEAKTEFAISCFHNVPNAIAAHIHRGPAGANGPVDCPFPNPNSPFQFVCPVSPVLLKALEQGNAYVNVHTPAHPGGEIRGQLR